MPGFLSRSANAIAMWFSDDDGNPLGTAANPLRTTSGAGAQPSTASQSVTPASDGAPFPVVGNVAAGAADSGAPVKIGGIVSSLGTTPGLQYPTLTSGTRANITLSRAGGVPVQLLTHDGFQISGGYPGDGYTNTQFIQIATMAHGMVWDGAGWNRQRGDLTGSWVHAPPSTVTNNSGTIATSGGTAAVAFTSTSDTEVFNASTATLWASWGTPAVNGAGSFPIIANGSYRPPSRVAGTLTLLSTTTNQTYTAPRYS